MFLVIDIARVFVNIGWASLVIVVFIVLYKLLIKRLSKNSIPQQSFIELTPLKDDKIKGKVQFFFKTKELKPVKFRIYSKTGDFEKVLADKEYSKGGHIINFDTNSLADGFYFYELKTDNQKITKLMEVKND